MTQYSVERDIKLKCGFLSFARKYRKQLLNIRLDTLKTASKKVVHKAAEAIGEFLGSTIAGKILKPDENPQNVAEIIILPEKREEILK